MIVSVINEITEYSTFDVEMLKQTIQRNEEGIDFDSESLFPQIFPLLSSFYIVFVVYSTGK